MLMLAPVLSMSSSFSLLTRSIFPFFFLLSCMCFFSLFWNKNNFLEENLSSILFLKLKNPWRNEAEHLHVSCEVDTAISFLGFELVYWIFGLKTITPTSSNKESWFLWNCCTSSLLNFLQWPTPRSFMASWTGSFCLQNSEHIIGLIFLSCVYFEKAL